MSPNTDLVPLKLRQKRKTTQEKEKKRHSLSVHDTCQTFKTTPLPYQPLSVTIHGSHVVFRVDRPDLQSREAKQLLQTVRILWPVIQSLYSNNSAKEAATPRRIEQNR